MQCPAICVYLWLWTQRTQSEIYGEHLLATTQRGSVGNGSGAGCYRWGSLWSNAAELLLSSVKFSSTVRVESEWENSWQMITKVLFMVMWPLKPYSNNGHFLVVNPFITMLRSFALARQLDCSGFNLKSSSSILLTTSIQHFQSGLKNFSGGGRISFLFG